MNVWHLACKPKPMMEANEMTINIATFVQSNPSTSPTIGSERK
jgi:hypothetical protein